MPKWAVCTIFVNKDLTRKVDIAKGVTKLTKLKCDMKEIFFILCVNEKEHSCLCIITDIFVSFM